MGFTEAISSVVSKYATFAGRARRAEFWWFVLFNMIVQAILDAIDRRMFGGGMMMQVWSFGGTTIEMRDGHSVLGGIYSLAVLVPTLAVTCRRLHDTDRSGWWQMIWLIPVIGWIILIVWLAGRGTTGPNRFGEDPVTETPRGGGLSTTSIPRVPRNQ